MKRQQGGVMGLRRFVGILVLSVVGAGLWAPVVPAADAVLKIGVVNVAKVFDGYAKTKTSDAALSKKGQQKQSEFDGRMAELNKLRDSLELLNGDAREAKGRELEEKADAIKRFRANAARDLQRERNVMAQGIVKEIEAAVSEYAKANGFSVILDDRSILFSQGAVTDVSEGVLQMLNGKYAKKAAGG